MSESLKKIMEGQKELISKASASENSDKNCPFTNGLKLRGKIFTGIVVSKDTHRTVIIEWSTRHFIKKYERFLDKKTKVAAHNPDVIKADVGDMVIIAECKPLSKTKNFVVIKNLGHSKDYMIKKESIDDDKKIADKKLHHSSESKKDLNEFSSDSEDQFEEQLEKKSEENSEEEVKKENIEVDKKENIEVDKKENINEDN
jgi:small subunit ribosomal protein S17